MWINGLNRTNCCVSCVIVVLLFISSICFVLRSSTCNNNYNNINYNNHNSSTEPPHPCFPWTTTMMMIHFKKSDRLSNLSITTTMNESMVTMNISGTNLSSNGSSSVSSNLPLAYFYSYIAIGMIGVLVNSLSCLVILSHAPLRKKFHNYFLLNQSLVDLTVSILLILTMTINPSNSTGLSSTLTCYLWKSRWFFVGLFLSSLFNTVAMTAERYLEVVHPIQHRVKMTRSKIIVSLIGVWIAGLLVKFFAVPRQVVQNGVCYTANFPNAVASIATGLYNACFEYFLSLSVIIYLYVKMMRSLRKSVVHPTAPAHSSVKARARVNILKTLFIVVVCYVITTTFKQILIIRNLIFLMPLDTNSDLFNVSQIIAYANWFADPIVYVFKYEEFRKGLKRLFRLKDTSASYPDVTTMGKPADLPWHTVDNNETPWAAVNRCPLSHIESN